MRNNQETGRNLENLAPKITESEAWEVYLGLEVQWIRERLECPERREKSLEGTSFRLEFLKLSLWM